jgi:hypothetical protein
VRHHFGDDRLGDRHVSAAGGRPGRALDELPADLPDRATHPHDPVLDGLTREVYEETGLKIEPGPLTGVYQNMQRNIVALVFRCSAAGGSVGDSDEVTAFRWVRAAGTSVACTGGRRIGACPHEQPHE